MTLEEHVRPGLRVVVTGATGNVGTAVVAALDESPAIESIIGVARRIPELTCPKTRWVAADVAEDDLEGIFSGADVVIHLAWLFQPTHRPVVTWRTNVVGTVRVLDAVAAAGVPALVCASSVGAYSPGPKDHPVNEQWPTHGWPGAAYTREKAYVERLLDSFECDNPGLRVVRLRPGFVFQRSAAAEQWRLFAGKLLPRQLVRPWAMPIVPNLAGLRFQVVQASDLAEAYLQAAVRRVSGAFNIATDPVVDVDLLARHLKAKIVPMPHRFARAAVSAGWHLRLIPVSPQLLEAVLRVPIMDTARAAGELGWTPRHSAHDALAELMTGLKQGVGAKTPPLRP
ncbi:MAG TPA: NAD-dependent epimerase/dehydratase family protein [Mycobacteriales bacterium]|nr:NAD-dependent epimerase/dehydratase family protein [Mycobacteriales bacterium]